jgi:hypothetical protein
MKKAIVLLGIIGLFGCNESNVKTKQTEFYIKDYDPLKIVEIDSCQYLFGDWGNATILTHKGNCDNPIHKLKSE